MFPHRRGADPDSFDWPGYLAAYHDARPGITEQVLTHTTTRDDEAPYAWLVRPLRDTTGPILDLACGSAPTQPLLADRRWLGLDSSAGELAYAATVGRGPLVQARADRLPVRDGTLVAVCAAMCLQVLTPLDQVLRELRRALRPSGMLVALVPARLPPIPRGWLGWWRVLHALGSRSQPWPNPGALDGLAGVLRANGFVVDSDERRVFQYPVTGPGEVALLLDSLYLPHLTSDRVDVAKTTLAWWARPGRALPIPLRRVVAHLPPAREPVTNAR